MDTVIDTVSDALSDASELVLDASFGDDNGSGGGLRKAVLGLLLIGAVIGIVLWRRSQSGEPEEVAEATAGSS